MKGVIGFVVLFLTVIGMSGCYTVPRHYSYQEVIIYYPPPPPPPEPYDPGPPPPTPPVYYPPSHDVNPPRDRQPEKPQDSYGRRDPLEGGSNRGGQETNTNPPVRTPVKKDRGQS